MQRPIMGLLLAVLLFGATIGKSSAEGPLLVYTVNYPLQYFAERIAGDQARVEFPAPPDIDPAFWMPTAENISGYQKADLILLNGAGYARWLDRASLPRSKLVNTSLAFKDRYLEVKAEPTHSHGPAGIHSHAGTAFTTWLDFRQAAQQARAIAGALIGKRPEMKHAFERGLGQLEEDLTALDTALEKIVADNRDLPLIASHPVYQYLARQYRLNLRSVQWEPGDPPTEEQWAALANILESHRARWMIWESETAPETARRLAELGLSSLVFDPGAHAPGSGDWLELMKRNLDNLRRAFE